MKCSRGPDFPFFVFSSFQKEGAGSAWMATHSDASSSANPAAGVVPSSVVGSSRGVRRLLSWSAGGVGVVVALLSVSSVFIVFRLSVSIHKGMLVVSRAVVVHGR